MEVRDCVGQACGDGCHTIACEVESLESMVLGKVGESGNIIVGEINGVFVLWVGAFASASSSASHCCRDKHTVTRPRFSRAGIL